MWYQSYYLSVGRIFKSGLFLIFCINILWANKYLSVFSFGTGLTVFQKREYKLRLKDMEKESDYKLRQATAPYGFNMFIGAGYSELYRILNQYPPDIPCPPGTPCPGEEIIRGSRGGIPFLLGAEYWHSEKELYSEKDTCQILYNGFILMVKVLGFTINEEIIKTIANASVGWGFDIVEPRSEFVILKNIPFFDLGIELGTCIMNHFFMTGGINFHFITTRYIKITNRTEPLQLEYPFYQVNVNLKIGFFLYSHK